MSGGDFPNPGRPPGEQFPAYSFSSLVPLRHWARDPALRSWPVLLLVALVCVPPIALVMLNDPTEAKIHDIAWIFAIYFAVAWLLLLGVIVRPQHVTRAMLAAIAVVGIVTQAPTAIFLETQLHSNTGSLLDVITIGVPEELAKAIPIVVVAWIWRREWHTQTPRDYLFLGAVSGLVFGAAEVVHYFTDVLGQLSGNATGLDLQTLTIQYVWRFLTDPIDHACWAGITGYFIGLAITGPVRRYSIGLIGIAIAAVLHGLNDWDPINSHIAWVLVTLISVLLFLGYARAGAWLPQQGLESPAGLAEARGPVPPAPWPAGPVGPAAAHPGPAGSPAPGGHGASPGRHSAPAGSGVPAGYGAPANPGAPAGQGSLAGSADTRDPPTAWEEHWWQRAPAVGTRSAAPDFPKPPAPQPAHASPAPPNAAAQHSAAQHSAAQHSAAQHSAAQHSAAQHSAAPQPTVAPRKPAPKPWWEQ
jgi:RsiW-degrading membrane proteinase PrsW (M82 family)